jgi:hypothetical protein
MQTNEKWHYHHHHHHRMKGGKTFQEFLGKFSSHFDTIF